MRTMRLKGMPKYCCYIICLVGVYFCGNVFAIRLELQPSDARIYKYTEESFTITCQARDFSLDSSFRPTLEWYGPKTPNRPLVDSDLLEYKGSLESYTNEMRLVLRFTKVRGDPQGKYRCRVQGNDQLEASVHLYIQPKITFHDTPLKQYPKNNSDATIRCTVTGNSPHISWLINKTRINWDSKSSDRYRTDNWGLHISKMTSKDNGNYTCRATDRSAGRSFEVEIEVTVAVPPTFAAGYQPEVLAVPIVKRMARIRCLAKNAHPYAEYNFFKQSRPNDKLTSDLDSRYVVRQYAGPNQDLGELEIRDLKLEDGGKYRCKAVNQVGSDEVVFDFDVIMPPELEKMDNQTYKLVTGKEDLTGSLTCNIKSDPKSTIQFQKVGLKKPYVLGVQPDDNRISVKEIKHNLGSMLAIYELRIKTLRPSDSSNYTCIATNPAETRRWNGTIKVEFRPDLSKTENSTFHWIGNIKNLTCIAMGEPIPVFTWFHRGEQIISGRNDTFKIYNETTISRLQIRIPFTASPQRWYWVFGQYSCNATNTIGIDSHVINVKRVVEPDKVDKVQIVSHTPTRITFKAQGPNRQGQMPILGYIIEYRRYNARQGAFERREFFTSNETLYMDYLRPNEIYNFRITAYNPVGQSQYGVDMKHTMIAVRKPYPILVTSKNVSTNPYFYILQWKEPENGGRGIMKYLISYRTVEVAISNGTSILSSGAWTDLEAQINPKQFSYQLQNLEPNNYYEVKISAQNSLGTSDITGQSKKIFKTMQATIKETGPIIAGSARVKLHLQAIMCLAVLSILLVHLPVASVHVP